MGSYTIFIFGMKIYRQMNNDEKNVLLGEAKMIGYLAAARGLNGTEQSGVE